METQARTSDFPRVQERFATEARGCGCRVFVWTDPVSKDPRQVLEWSNGLIATGIYVRRIQIDLGFGCAAELPVAPANFHVTPRGYLKILLEIGEGSGPCDLRLSGNIRIYVEAGESESPAEVPRGEHAQTSRPGGLIPQNEVGRAVKP